MTIRTNLSERLAEGRQLARGKHREGDAAKLGTLRAGNSGMMSEAGDIAGSCHRRAHLRSLGLEVEEPDDSKLVMFQMGTANEDVVYQDLLHTKAENEVILREEEIPTKWFTDSGTAVTGRPDMVVCRRYQPGVVDAVSALVVTQPLFGVEIKSIASVWTTREVLGEMHPKLEHLIQAGHYSWQLGVPFRLLYKQYSIQEIPRWAIKMFPQPGQPGAEHIDHEKGRVKPFEIVYELDWIKDVLHFRRESSSKLIENQEPWTRSLVGVADIKRYYEFVSTMAVKEELGPRPMTIDALGKEKNYSGCDYCPLQNVCDSREKQGYSSWLDAVRVELGE